MKRTVAVLAILIFSIALCTIISYAYFFAPVITQSADAQAGIVQVQLNETFPQTDANGAPADTVKTFWGDNTGNKAAYVRAHIFPCPEYHYIGTDTSGNAVDQWRPLSIPISTFQFTTTSPDWIDGGGGYLYYSKILKPGDVTSQVKVSMEVADPDALPDGIDIRLNLRVEMESAQATHDMYKTVFNIAELPNGVEIIGD